MSGAPTLVPERLTIGRLTIAGTSRIEARRIADELPAALARVAARAGGAPIAVDPRAGTADRVAAEIWRALAPRLDRGQ